MYKKRSHHKKKFFDPKPPISSKWIVRDMGYTTPCWIWTASLNDRGYGVYKERTNAKNYKAHRYVYEKFKAKIPDGMELHHLCHNRACVNIDHMQIVTHQENIILKFIR